MLPTNLSLKGNSVSQKIAGVAWWLGEIYPLPSDTGRATNVASVTDTQYCIPCNHVRNPFASVVKYLAFSLCLCSIIILLNSISTKKKLFSILKCGLHSYTLTPQCRFLLIFFHSIELQPLLSPAGTSLNGYHVQQRLIFHFSMAKNLSTRVSQSYHLLCIFVKTV